MKTETESPRVLIIYIKVKMTTFWRLCRELVYYRKIEKHRQKLKYLLVVNQNAGAEEDNRHT